MDLFTTEEKEGIKTRLARTAKIVKEMQAKPQNKTNKEWWDNAARDIQELGLTLKEFGIEPPAPEGD